MPTTSRPPRRSRGKRGSVSEGSPLKGIRISFTLVGAGREQLERLVEKGLNVEERGADLSVALAASSPEEALAQLRALSSLLAQKT